MPSSATRTIVRYGIYKFTEEELASLRLRISTSVIREPSPKYTNYEWTKEKSFFGHWQLLKGDYICAYGDINFVDQILYEEENLRLKLTQLANCINLNTYNVVAALAAGLGASYIIGEPTPFNAPPFQFDRILIKNYSNATIVVQVDAETEDNPCGFPVDREDNLPQAGGHNDQPPEPNPLDEPFDLGTPPYDSGTRDNGETYVPEAAPEEPVYSENRAYTWTIRWRYYDGTPATPRVESGIATGPLYPPRVAVRPSSFPGLKNVAIEFEAGSPPTIQTARIDLNVPLSEPDPYFIIVEFSAV